MMTIKWQIGSHNHKLQHLKNINIHLHPKDLQGRNINQERIPKKEKADSQSNLKLVRQNL
jgi:hypothetical protein